MKAVFLLVIAIFLLSCGLQEALDSKVIIRRANPQNPSGPVEVESQNKFTPTGERRSLSNSEKIRQDIVSIDKQIEGLNDRLRQIRKENSDSNALREEISSIERSKQSLLSRRKVLESRLS